MTQEQYYWYVRRQLLLNAYRQQVAGGVTGFRFNNLKLIADFVFYKENAKQDLDYEFAKSYFAKKTSIKAGLCSGVLSKDLKYHGRNLDWYYNNEVTVVNKTSNEVAKHASIGFCLSHADQDLVKSGAESDEIRIIPFNLDDGINDAGLTIQINVIPCKANAWPKPTPEDGYVIPDKMVVRYVLDNFDNAEEAAKWVVEHAYYTSTEYNYHWIVSDASNAFLIEDGKYKSIIDRPYMTNCRVIEDIRTSDLKDVDIDKVLANDRYGVGIERYKIILDNYNKKSNDIDGLKSLMSEDLLYTNAYKDPKEIKYGEKLWYSENCGIYPYGDQTVYFDVKDACTPSEDRAYIRDLIYGITLERFKEHLRGNNFWHTTWTSIYDRENRKVHVRFLQGETIDLFIEFELN